MYKWVAHRLRDSISGGVEENPGPFIQINNDKNAPCVKQVNSVSLFESSDSNPNYLNLVEFQPMYWERETVFFCAVSCQLYNIPEYHLYICSLGVQHVLHHPELYIESNCIPLAELCE